MTGEQRGADALEVAAEDELRHAPQQNGEPEGDEDLHHATVEPHRKGARYQQVIDRHPHSEQRDRHRDEQQQRIEAGH